MKLNSEKQQLKKQKQNSGQLFSCYTVTCRHRESVIVICGCSLSLMVSAELCTYVLSLAGIWVYSLSAIYTYVQTVLWRVHVALCSSLLVLQCSLSYIVPSFFSFMDWDRWWLLRSPNTSDFMTTCLEVHSRITVYLVLCRSTDNKKKKKKNTKIMYMLVCIHECLYGISGEQELIAKTSFNWACVYKMLPSCPSYTYKNK